MSLARPATTSSWSSSATRCSPCPSRCWAPRWRPATRTAGTRGSRTGWASCSAWRRPARRRWRSTAWPIAPTMRSNPRTAGRHLPAGQLSVRSVAALHGCVRRGLHRLDAPVPAEPLAALLCRSPSCSGCWATRTPSGSPASPTSGWGSRSAWRPSPPGSPCAATCAWPPVLLAMAVLFWVAGFDIIYACQDVDFDRRAGLRSIPGALGRPQRPPARGRVPCPDDRPPRRSWAWSTPWDRSTSSGRGRRRAAGLRARPGPPRRPDPRQRRLLPGEHRDQPRPARRRRPRPARSEAGSAPVDDSFNSD